MTESTMEYAARMQKAMGAMNVAQPERERTLSDVIETLDKRVVQLHEALAQLTTTLDPVLMQEPENPNKPPPLIARGGSPAMRKLDELADAVENATGKVFNLQRRALL